MAEKQDGGDEESSKLNGEADDPGEGRNEASPQSRIRKPLCRIPWRGCLALLGGFLIQLTLGSFYSFGNMMTYMTSYMR